VGYNSVVLILNDELHRIKEDKNYGEKLYFACSSFRHEAKGGWQPNEAPGARVLHVEHADVTALILAGGNCGKVVGYTYNSGRFWSPNDTETAIKACLRDEYRVAKLKVPRGRQPKDETPAPINVVDQVADLGRPKQVDLGIDLVRRLSEENRLLKLEIEALKAKLHFATGVEPT
jgi:hypothetical protein